MTTRSQKAAAGVTSTATFYFQPPKKFRMEKESSHFKGQGKRLPFSSYSTRIFRANIR